MNERIEEIAEQAEQYVDDSFKGEPTWSEVYDSKFAELIILETLAEMAIQMSKFGDEQSCNPTWYKAQETVKQHFGVEE